MTTRIVDVPRGSASEPLANGKQGPSGDRQAGVASWVLALACLLLVASIAAAQAASDETTLISRQSAADGGAAADGHSYGPSISADGRYVAFASGADNLSAEDNDGGDDILYGAADDVFIRDTRTNTTTLVSRSAVDAGAGGSFRLAEQPSISADGRYVAFASYAANLSPDDSEDGEWTASDEDVFVRDTHTNTTTLVSRKSAADGGADGNYESDKPSISANGRYVAFTSGADNLSAEDRTTYDVFIRDTYTDTTTLVSRQSAADGGDGGNGYSADPSISADGRYVAFVSQANNFTDGEAETSPNVFIRDTHTKTTTFVGNGPLGSYPSPVPPSISADGRYVAFVDGQERVSVYDRHAKTVTLASRAGDDVDPGEEGPSISGDGRYVAYSSGLRNDRSEDRYLFVRDTKTSTTTLVSGQGESRAGDRPPGHEASGFQLSADGGHIAFHDDTDDLSAEDNDAFLNVFLRSTRAAARPPDSTAPVLTRLSIARRFAVSSKPTAKEAIVPLKGKSEHEKVKRGTKIRYRLSEDARVKIAIEQRRRGIRLETKSEGKSSAQTAGRCVADTKRNRARLRREMNKSLRAKRLSGDQRRRSLERQVRRARCARYKRKGTLTRSGSRGRNSHAFSGRIGRRALTRGRYRIVVTGTHPEGNVSKPKRKSFRIVGARKR